MKNKKKEFHFITLENFIKDIEHIFLNTNIKKIFIPDPEYKYIIALSGGPDSILLSYLYYIFYKKKWIKEPILFHFNHQIREEANKEEEFVIKFANRLKIPIYVETRNILNLSKKLKRNLEETARIYRYRSLYRLTKNFLEPSFVVTGHHGDDYIETIFLRLLRGSSLYNIFFFTKRNIPITIANKIYFLRILSPLLLFDKTEILNVLDKKKIKYLVDSSNYNLNYKRNFIRHSILKPLKNSGLKPGIIWQKTHLGIQHFSGFDYNHKDFFIIDKNIFANLYEREIKIIFDQISKILGIQPIQKHMISEFIYQSFSNRIYLQNKQVIIESVRNKIWFIRKDSLLLKEPEIRKKNNKVVILWNNQTRFYKNNTILLYLKIEENHKIKYYVKEILREKEIPLTIRSLIPYIKNEKEEVVKIILSFINGYWDICFFK